MCVWVCGCVGEGVALWVEKKRGMGDMTCGTRSVSGPESNYV